MSEIATMSVEQAAKILGIGRCTAFRLAAEGKIPALRLGRRLLVSKVALEELLRNPTGARSEVRHA